MTDTAITAHAAAALALPAPTIEATRRYLHAQVAPATLRAYQADFRAFAAWCASDAGGRGASAFPAAPEVVAAFLAAQADAGVKVATIRRRAAAIHFRHASAQIESPTRSMLVTAALKGIRRELGVAPARKAPATALRLIEMARLCPATLPGRRDRALLLLGFGGALRRSELVALQVEDLEVLPQGLRVTIRRSKTDQEGVGQVIAIARGEVHCPVVAVQEWLQAAAITTGPVLRRVRKGGCVGHEALSDRAVADIVKAYAERAGFDAQAFSGHSLRAGFLTSAAEAGAGVLKLVEVSRHRSLDTVRGYVRSAELFKDHAGAGLL
jgi:site-specific recombinase XerD